MFRVEHGVVPGGRCAVLGMGKLGSREMTATSDLDLILLYDFDDARPDSDGKRPLHATQYYTRLTQRLISALTVSTRRGDLYEVDMRLRPSGRQGPVATKLGSFKDYQASEA
jgi:glutamate-ammonia-ligase adenylyltransferase